MAKSSLVPARVTGQSVARVALCQDSVPGRTLPSSTTTCRCQHACCPSVSAVGPEKPPGRAGWQSCCALLLQLYQNVPLELCSELRPVTSLFVQLQFADKISTVELSSSLSNSSSMISEIISPHKGEINKSLLFDKVSV